MKYAYVYIMTNKNRTTFYIGVTNDIEERVFQHKMKKGSKFTSKYNLTDLVYFEEIFGINSAIEREKELKQWRREWKLALIKKENPKMRDLSEGWF